MRVLLTALGLGLAMAGAAAAADLGDPVWVKAPDRTDWAHAYPPQAAQAGVEGKVRLRCSVKLDGMLERCAALEEAPLGQGFAAAAVSLATGMQLSTRSQSGHSTAGQAVIVPVRFTREVMAHDALITNPDWLKKPNADDLGRWWPTAAHGGSGKAVIGCIVTNRGLLEKCHVQSESPAGQGFGYSTLLLAPTFLMRPMTVDGQPVGGAEIHIPVTYKGGGDPGPDAGPAMRVADHLPWATTPTAAAMAAIYPKSAIGHVDSGHVVLRCHVVGDGVLKDCDTASESPSGQGFAQAARRLTPQFKVAITPEVLKQVKNLYINLPFDFRDPSKPSPPLEIVDPQWLRTVDASMVARLFPKAASDAGLITGRGVVNCGLAHTGELIDCRTVAEEPAGMGFGAAALAVAGAMQMNPWTQQGAPLEGARVKLPIRLYIKDDAPAASAAAPAKP